ncbi:MAG: DUF4349 domain-containing protein [Fimbriimonadaceae bacterium]|nr:DUF4349 domain-containing protein [Fimbriimonadaceae bacterium]
MKRTLIALLAATTILSGCSKASYETASAPEAMMKQDVATMGPPKAENSRVGGAEMEDAKVQTASLVVATRQVIRNAELAVRVKKIEDAEKAATKLVREAGGYIEGTSSSDLAGNNPQIVLTARVPVGRFDDTLQSLIDLGIATSKTIKGEDVTSQLVDMDARMKTFKAQEDSYREMLRLARSGPESLTLREKLDGIRMEVERIAAQRTQMAGLASLSTIRLTLDQSLEAMPIPAKDQNWLQEAWAQASGAFMGAIRVIATGLIWLAVYSPIWLTALLILRHVVRSQRKSTDVHA